MVVDETLIEEVLFIYSTKSFKSKDKVRFHYFMKGRNGNMGFLDKVEGKHLTSSALLIPKAQEDNVEMRLNEWGIPFEKHNFLRKIKDD